MIECYSIFVNLKRLESKIIEENQIAEIGYRIAKIGHSHLCFLKILIHVYLAWTTIIIIYI
jgi:hypothetical protein